MIPLSIIIARFPVESDIFFSSAYNNRSNQAQILGAAGQLTDPAPAELTKNVAAITPDDHILGSFDARVKIIEFSDLDCTFCQKIHSIFQQITKDYGEDEVAWVYRHFPLTQMRPDAAEKARVSECATNIGGNDGFWNFLDVYFLKQDASLGVEYALDIAEESGLNRQGLEACLAVNDFADKLGRDTNYAVNSGGTGTPFNIITDGETFVPISSAYPYEVFKAEIDKLLDK